MAVVHDSPLTNNRWTSRNQQTPPVVIERALRNPETPAFYIRFHMKRGVRISRRESNRLKTILAANLKNFKITPRRLVNKGRMTLWAARPELEGKRTSNAKETARQGKKTRDELRKKNPGDPSLHFPFVWTWHVLRPGKP